MQTRELLKHVLLCLATCTVYLCCAPSEIAARSILMLDDGPTSTMNTLRPDRSNRRAILEALQASHHSALNQLRPVLDKKFPTLSVVATLPLINAIIVDGEMDSARAALLALGAVAAIYADEPVELPQALPCEMRAPPSNGWSEGLSAIGVIEARRLFGLDGSSILVGHIDSGVDGTHPALAGRIAVFRDFLDDNSPLPEDSFGHGTHVAGTICGLPSNGIEIGVAPGAQLVVGRALGDFNSTSKLLRAMDWICDPDGDPATDDGPRVVNCSWNSNSTSEPFYKAIETWLVLGIFPCFSAGNRGPEPNTVTRPKEHPSSFAVGAVDLNDGIAEFSSRGPATYKGQSVAKPDVTAPGVRIYSAKMGGGFSRMKGTSMAAPHIAGLVALLIEGKPTLTVEELRSILTGATIDCGTAGYDYSYGHGRISVVEALQQVIPGQTVTMQVVDGQSGEPVTAEVTFDEYDYHFVAHGTATRYLPCGSHQLTVQAYGYLPQTSTITVTADEWPEDRPMTEIIELDPSPLYTVSGRVRSKVSAQPLAAQLSVPNTPLTTVETDPTTGHYQLQLPVGTYVIAAQAFAHRPTETDSFTVSGSRQLDIELDHVPPYLLVDDDGRGNTVEQWYHEALGAAGLTYDVHSVAVCPLTTEALFPYETVIWYTGVQSHRTLTATDQELLVEYLHSGGRLLLTGRDIGFDIHKSSFFEEVLGAEYRADNAREKAVEGLGFFLPIKGDGGANNQTMPDHIECNPAGTSKLVMRYEHEKGAGVSNTCGTGRSLYLAFGIEGIPDAGLRGDFLRACLDFLAPTRAQLVQRLRQLPPHLRLSYFDTVLLPRLGSAGLKATCNRLQQRVREDCTLPFRLYRVLGATHQRAP